MRLRSFRIVGLEGIVHTKQLGVFSSVKEVKTSPYHIILIDMYVLCFKSNPYHMTSMDVYDGCQ